MTGAAPEDILVTEVFSAIQGEAALVGERQVFVRLTGCNIRCAYCDQPEALERRPGPFRLERTAGRRDWHHGQSPVPIASVAEAVDRMCTQLPHHSVSLTGGEPLLQVRRVAELGRLLADGGHRVMLETNGTLAPALGRILPFLSYVSMDLKLASVDGETVDPAAQRRFLALSLRGGPTTWVKMVIGPATDGGEFDAAVAMVAEEAEAAGTGILPDLFLQPLTPFAGATAAPTPEQVLDLQERALRIYPRVRVVPQTHKAIGQL